VKVVGRVDEVVGAVEGRVERWERSRMMEVEAGEEEERVSIAYMKRKRADHQFHVRQTDGSREK
jgi:hypothetical protein